MRRRTQWVAIAVIVIVLASYGTYLKMQQPQETVKIGAILQLTGVDAQYGDWSRKGLDLAAEEINSLGGVDGRKIKIIYEDSQSQPSLAASALRKLRDVDNVSLIITQASSITLALAPLSNQERIIQMDVGSVTPKYRTENDYTFRTAITALQLAQAQAKMIALKGIKKVGFLYVNDEYGIGMRDVFKRAYEQFGGIIVAEEVFANTDTDFRTQLSKFKEKNLSTVVIVTRLNKGGIILRQAKEIGLESQIFSDVYGIEDQQTLDAAGEAAEGVLYVAPAFDINSSSISMKFAEKFQTKYGTMPVQLSAQAYDGILALAYALENCTGSDTDCIKNELYKLDFEGASGRIKFDSTGDVVEKPVELKTIINGTFVRYVG